MLADQVRFDLQAERQIGAMKGLGDLPQLVHHLRHVLARIAPLGMVERKSADQLRLERVGQFAGLLHVSRQVLLERDVNVLGPVLDVLELDLADGRADRRNIQTVLVLKLPHLLDLREGELHHVLDAVAGVDEPDAVVLET